MSERPPSSHDAPHVVGMLVQALADSDLVLALYDPADRLQWANRRFHDLFLRGVALPVDFADILRHGFTHRFGVKIDCGDIEQFLADILPRRRSIPFRAFATDTVEGMWLWMTETLLPNGWLLSCASDITALKQHERVLREAHAQVLHDAQTDALTGAASRPHALEALQQALGRLDDSEPLSVALTDIDDFKRINERFGHPRGDEVLAAYVAQCRQRLRPNDLVGRMGGHEFLLAFPGIRDTMAVRIVERLRLGLASPGVGAFGFAAGVTQALPGESVAALLARVAERLSVAKARGHGCTVLDP